MRKNNNKNIIMAAIIIVAVALCAVCISKPLALEEPVTTVTDTTNETTAATEAVEVVPTENVPEVTVNIDLDVEVPEVTEPATKAETVVVVTPSEPEANKPAAHTHSYKSVVTAPTCTEAGYTTCTCSCGDSYVDHHVNAVGHDYKSVVTAPDVGSVGYTTCTCTACGDSYIDGYTDALQPEPTQPAHKHEYIAIRTIKSNCTTEGYTVFECDCGDAYNGDYTAKAEHNYKDTVVAPTTEAEGYTIHMCVGCGDSYKDSYTDVVKPTVTPTEPTVTPTEPTVKPTEPAPTEPAPTEPSEEITEPTEAPTEPSCGCDRGDGHNHEEVVVGQYTYVYCDNVLEPAKGEDGFTVYYPYDFY